MHRRETIFRERLQRSLRGKVNLVVTDNSHVFLNARSRRKIWTVRLHWMFLHASRRMPKIIARFILQRDKKISKMIDQFIERHWNWVHHPMPVIRTEGKFFDLQRIFDSLNRRYLRGAVKAKITWGRDPGRRAYEQLQMGSFSSVRRLITIHPHLDRKFVPRYVVEACVFHEMCHALAPTEIKNGRKLVHTKRFARLEAKYPHLRKAQIWEDKNLQRLMRVQKGSPH